MSIIQQIRGDPLPAQSSGIPAGLQILPTGISEFGKYLPSEIAVQSPGKVDGVSSFGSIYIEPRGSSSLALHPLSPDIALCDANGSSMRPLPPGIAPGPPQINQDLLDATLINPGPPQIDQGLLDATLINPGPPQIDQGLLDATLINPGPPQIGSGFGQNNNFHPFPPDIASRGASGSGNLVIGSQPPIFSGEIESKLTKIDLFHSIHSARAYALNSIVDVLDKGAYGTIV